MGEMIRADFGSGSERGRVPEDAPKGGEPKKRKWETSHEGAFENSAVVNGTEIDVHFDDEYGDYVLFLPQITLGEESLKKDVPDQLFRISKDPEVAKEIFKKTIEMALEDSDPYRLYVKALDFFQKYDKKLAS